MDLFLTKLSLSKLLLSLSSVFYVPWNVCIHTRAFCLRGTINPRDYNHFMVLEICGISVWWTASSFSLLRSEGEGGGVESRLSRVFDELT